MGLDSSAYRLAMGWVVRGSKPGGGDIFCTCTNRPWGPPSLIYMGTGSFPGVNWLGRDVNHPTHLALGLKKEYSYTSIPSLGLHGLF
jgi:hypothetical protein